MTTLVLTPRHYTDGAGDYLGVFYGDAQPPPGASQVSEAPGPSYRKLRRLAYEAQIGKDPGDTVNTLGDVLDIVIAELYARGPAVTAEFATLIGKVAAIKAAYPKPT